MFNNDFELHKQWMPNKYLMYIGIISLLIFILSTYFVYLYEKSTLSIYIVVLLFFLFSVLCLGYRKHIAINRNVVTCKVQFYFYSKKTEYQLSDYSNIKVVIKASEYGSNENGDLPRNLLYVLLITKSGQNEDFDLTDYLPFSRINQKTASLAKEFAVDVGRVTGLSVIVSSDVKKIIEGKL